MDTIFCGLNNKLQLGDKLAPTMQQRIYQTHLGYLALRRCTSMRPTVSFDIHIKLHFLNIDLLDCLYAPMYPNT